jgi:hypothetical protein
MLLVFTMQVYHDAWSRECETSESTGILTFAHRCFGSQFTVKLTEIKIFHMSKKLDHGRNVITVQLLNLCIVVYLHSLWLSLVHHFVSRYYCCIVNTS